MKSIRITLCVFALLFTPILALADEPSFDSMTNIQIEQYCAAGNGGTREIEYCANREFQKADRKLNVTYNQALALIKANSAISPMDKSMRHKFVKAQKLWISFRDAECSAHYTYYIDGTIRGLMFISCKTQLTEQREKDLREFYLSTN
ncbi:MAG: DUF1311 domain-containing protein [Candidatus Saccharibacteria bacterium]|nr:DUF1311 domain-containing protein [Moraxellaceae bacterium]